MAWESAAIGLLTDALKSVLGRIMESGQERRAAQLISEATRELLLEHPHIEEVKSKLIEAEKLLKTPSPQLLHAQFFLDRVTQDYTSAQFALGKMRNVYKQMGSVKGVAEANELSAITFIEMQNYSEAADLFQQVVNSYKQIGDFRSLVEIFPHALEAYIHENLNLQAQELVSENIEIAIRSREPEKVFAILISLGMIANSCNSNLLAVKAFSTAWAMQESDKLWSQIKECSSSLSLSESQLNNILVTTKENFQEGKTDELVLYLFNNEN